MKTLQISKLYQAGVLLFLLFGTVSCELSEKESYPIPFDLCNASDQSVNMYEYSQPPQLVSSKTCITVTVIRDLYHGDMDDKAIVNIAVWSANMSQKLASGQVYVTYKTKKVKAIYDNNEVEMIAEDY